MNEREKHIMAKAYFNGAYFNDGHEHTTEEDKREEADEWVEAEGHHVLAKAPATVTKDVTVRVSVDRTCSACEYSMEPEPVECEVCFGEINYTECIDVVVPAADIRAAINER